MKIPDHAVERINDEFAAKLWQAIKDMPYSEAINTLEAIKLMESYIWRCIRLGIRDRSVQIALALALGMNRAMQVEKER